MPQRESDSSRKCHHYSDTLLVDNVDEAFASFLSAGGVAIQPLFDIAIGRCARIRDPFATNWSYWINQKAGWLLTPTVELRVSSRGVNKVRVAKRTATEAIKISASRRPPNEASPLPRWIPPRLCQLFETAPSGAQWLHEIKLDGFRLSARIERGRGAIADADRTGLERQISERG